MMANKSPPTPLLVGSISPSTALVAMAASIAFPPRSMICIPDIAAIGWLAATIPSFVAITDRPGIGRGLPAFGAGAFWAMAAIPISANASIARIGVLNRAGHGIAGGSSVATH